ncbi:hypothetical protein CFK38_00590 [Brachybacterium vulturis]|uniref:Uncharacterized protein n=1 Tax=Brachybacterium vulturis TaxID=2017484 RepID=A0A291GI12_9MICO|nr:hypothetical protein CFK38_00590 [Brachybacterium vulturis]
MARPCRGGGDGRCAGGAGRVRGARLKRCAASHPFWTGRSGVVDTAGHLERLRRRYADTIVTPHRLTA